MENSWFDNVSLDIEQTPAIIKVLDAGEVSNNLKSIVNLWSFHLYLQLSLLLQ